MHNQLFNAMKRFNEPDHATPAIQPLSQTDKQQVNAIIDELLQQANKAYNVRFKRPAISWRRAGKNAGSANLTQNRINFNPVLFAHNREAFFSQVVVHELCHILVHQHYGRVRPHGPQWQKMMEETFGVPARVTHSFDLTPLQLTTYAYRCKCGPVELSVRRHNKVVRQQQSYYCRRCKQTLEPV